MTIWRKNEPVPIKRQCGIMVYKSGVPAPVDSDLIAAGMVWVRGANSPNADAALGTMTNVRRALTLPDDIVEAVNVGADTLQLTGHAYKTGDGPMNFHSSGAIPPGSIAAPYVIVIDADNIALADTLAHAYDGTKLDLTGAGSGVITMSTAAGSQRGIPGRFVYQATQLETNHDGAEMEITVDDGGIGNYALADGNGGSAFVTMDQNGGILDTIITADGKTFADVLRFLYGTDGAGEIDKDPVTGAYSVWNETHTKVIATGVLTADGRHTVVVGDLSL